MNEPELEPWQWTEPHWRKIVNHVRAGRRLRPAHWKDGARCAVALSFDSDHETNELRDGGKSIGRLSWGQYGNRVGVPRILKVLRQHDVRASFYVPAVTALLYPDEQRQVANDGHEIGIHGWIHELNSVLPHAAERDLMLRAADILERSCFAPTRGRCAIRPRSLPGCARNRDRVRDASADRAVPRGARIASCGRRSGFARSPRNRYNDAPGDGHTVLVGEGASHARGALASRPAAGS